jgi:protein O-GlcNAc transferase
MIIDPAYGDWLARGKNHQQAGFPIDAMLCFRKAATANRHSVLASFHLGEVLSTLRLRDDAIAAWRAALSMQPRHVPSLLAIADELLRARAYADAAPFYRQVLAIETNSPEARAGLALALIGAGDPQGFADVANLIASGTTRTVAWDELTRGVAAAAPSPARSLLLERIEAMPGGDAPAPLLALAAEDAASRGQEARARALVNRLESLSPAVDDVEALRWLALAAEGSASAPALATRYAARCVQAHAPTNPVQWPRRAAGDSIRVAYLIEPERTLHIGAERVDPAAYFEHVGGGLDRDRFTVVAFIVDGMRPDAPRVQSLRGMRVATIGSARDAAVARALGDGDYDVLIDLAGMRANTGPLLAATVARSTWTIAGLRDANVAPLIAHVLPAPDGGDATALSAHRVALEAALAQYCESAAWFHDRAGLAPDAMTGLWRKTVAAHQAGNTQAALADYDAVLAEQPGFAPALYMSALLLRDSGFRDAAQARLAAAIKAAPAYSQARAALANLCRERGDVDGAAQLCRDGLVSGGEADVALWRALGLCELARHDAAAARDAFVHALDLVPTDGQTHYNHGVALQTLHHRDEALRAYQRALTFAPDLLAAEFNIGVVFQEQGRTDPAIAVFEKVLARDRGHVMAYKALGDTLLSARRVDDWLSVFGRFEAACPKALALVPQALEACQYRGDFAGLDRYLDRLRQDDFIPQNESDLADSLEQILFLMLYFDLEPSVQLGLYRAYDAVAKRVYGTPLPPAAARRPGRLRIGYLSGDLRNHVMGKMSWEAIRHHDRERFAIFCYAGGGASDDVTEEYRRFADRFENFAELGDRDAALRIAGDDLDILVDLSTHTKNARPGILALKPARVQITHIASSGALGLDAVDFKLTDEQCDPPENQAYMIETLLPMEGCVYPYRHVQPSRVHPFHREQMQIAADRIVIGAFVNPLKLSQRCLSLWREVLGQLPDALLAVSPLSREASGVYMRLLTAAGIPVERVIVLPQGRDDAEGQARYTVLDFALDPMPYGGVNSTLEAVDMGVPVVTLRGRKHGERTTTSILANLGVTQTIADSGSEYVAIAMRLATDATFRAEVKASIAAGLKNSALVNMPRHTRALEAAYERALAQTFPDVLAQATRPT